MSIWAALLLTAVAACGGERPRAPADDARATVRSFASCIVDGELLSPTGGKLPGFFRMSPFGADVGPMLVKMSTGWCLGQRTGLGDRYVKQLRAAPALLRGAMFRALYQRQFGGANPTVLREAAVQASWRIPGDDAFTALQLLGECVVRAEPQNARRAIFAASGSEAETAAYAALQPHLGQCATVGTNLRFSRAMFEALLAEGLYHLSGGRFSATVPPRSGALPA